MYMSTSFNLITQQEEFCMDIHADTAKTICPGLAIQPDDTCAILIKDTSKEWNSFDKAEFFLIRSGKNPITETPFQPDSSLKIRLYQDYLDTREREEDDELPYGPGCPWNAPGMSVEMFI